MSSERPDQNVSGPVWDRQRLLDRYDGDTDTVLELCQALRQDLPTRISQLAAAAEAGDAEGVTRFAHSIKGICGTIAAEPCRLLALEVETNAREGRIEPVPLEKLLACLDKLLDEIPDLHPRGDRPTPPGPSP